jgi:hypothetical protein
MPFNLVSLKYTPVAARFLLSFVLVYFNFLASAQQGSQVAFINIDSAESWFDRIVNPKSAAILNGPAYYIAFKGLNTHPFYQSAESDRSFVRYDNDLYKNLDLLYDTYGDILVLKYVTPNGAFFIELDKNLVQGFDLHHHHFKKFSDVGSQSSAYVDVLFEAKQFAVVVRRIKIQRIEGRIRNYLEDDVFYIMDHGKSTRVTGAGSFAKTLAKEQRKELAGYIKNNHIKLRKRKDEDLKQVAAFCYSLKEKK